MLIGGGQWLRICSESNSSRSLNVHPLTKTLCYTLLNTNVEAPKRGPVSSDVCGSVIFTELGSGLGIRL